MLQRIRIDRTSRKALAEAGVALVTALTAYGITQIDSLGIEDPATVAALTAVALAVGLTVRRIVRDIFTGEAAPE